MNKKQNLIWTIKGIAFGLTLPLIFTNIGGYSSAEYRIKKYQSVAKVKEIRRENYLPKNMLEHIVVEATTGIGRRIAYKVYENEYP